MGYRCCIPQCFKVICEENEDGGNLEESHLAKRAKRGADGDLEFPSDDSTDTDDYTDQPSTNHMNSSLLSLYRRGNPDCTLDSPSKNEAPDTSTPAPHKPPRAEGTGDALESRPPRAGWFIDKTPSKPPERNIFIDLCEDGDGGQRAEDNERSADASLLESEKKQRKMKKSRRGKMTDDVDEEIKSTLMKKKAETIELQKSFVRFEDVGGNDDTLTEVCKLLIHMRHPEVYQHLGVVPPRGFLLHGPPGCGKTLLAQAIAGELDLPMLKVAATEMVSGVSGESEQKLRSLFEQALSSAPCILFIDEIDAITPKREVASKDMERRIVAQLLTCMDDMNNPSVTAQVLVIGATNRPDSLDPALRRAGRFDREICLGIPDEGARLKILKTLCRKLRLPECFDFQRLAHLTPGYVGADLMALCREAAMCAVNRALIQLRQRPTAEEPEMEDPMAKPPPAEVPPAQVSAGDPICSRSPPAPLLSCVTELQRLLEVLMEQSPFPEEQLQGLCIEMSDFMSALPSVQPSAKREGFATVPDVTWEDIGALDEIREELTMAILAPVRNPEQFKALGLMAPAGVLLAGPPGCGKTLLAKAVANESGLNFISVKGPELLNMVSRILTLVKVNAPCGRFSREPPTPPRALYFFDEIDALCPRRSSHESGSSVRVVNQLLTEMDGLETRRQVFIMAATNRPDIIDPAILRPGRLDKTLYVGLPPPSDRLAILRTITKGADLSALIREASISALRSEMFQENPAVPRAEILVYKKHFDEAFRKVKPSVSKMDQMMYERLRLSLSAGER
ncbi:unnamed protein product [Ranitomeya imitator]|uniref:AAA+ ATPase domain-containing protein n=1 Tax=Ranitomeya imitator TaxID=111125 RepID=A0ABN9LD50_9NEOB|nr:unnamed protein product [Ranitomeya imitator]